MRYRTQVMVVFVMALCMTIIDGTMVNVALPKMADDFGVQSTDIEWIAVGYLLSYASVIPASGWLGDRFGTRRVFIVALSAFVVFSILCGLAQTLPQLVVLRILQGAGGGMLTPIGSAMLYRAFSLEERAKAAIGVLSVAVVAPAVGPLLGGALVDFASWHWIFLINGPVGAVAIALSMLWLREETHDDPGTFDGLGFVLSITAVSTLLYALSTAPERGWGSPVTIGLLCVGLATGAGLIYAETHRRHPMLALRLFRDRLFRTINLAAVTIYAGFFGMIFVLPLYMQTLRGYSAFESGLAQAPQALGIFLLSNLAGKRLYQAVGPRRLMVVGALATALITCAYALTGLSTPLGVISFISFLRGLAVGPLFVSIQTGVYATTSNADTGRATSLFNTQRQVSYAAGVAMAATVVSALLTDVGGDAAPAADRLPAYQWGFIACGVVMIPAVFISWFIHDEDVAATRGLAPAEPAASPARAG
jgi:EmrB/QacA subfamily drug resistance transporter